MSERKGLLSIITSDTYNSVKLEQLREYYGFNRLNEMEAGSNPLLAKWIKNQSDELFSQVNLIHVGTIIHDLIRRQQLPPKVTQKALDSVYRDYAAQETYINGLIRRLHEGDNPLIASFIDGYAQRSPENPHVRRVGAMTYAFLEEQARVDISSQTWVQRVALNLAAAEERFEDAVKLKKEIEGIDGKL